MTLLQRRTRATRLHGDAVDVLTAALKDLRRAMDAPDPLLLLDSASEKVRTAESVIEGLKIVAESLRPLGR